MRVTTKSTARKPSLEMARTILAQVYLLTALEELTDLRKTMRLQAVALIEKLKPGQFSNNNGQSGSDLATVQRRDRKFARRLGKLQTSVNKASRLLIPPDGKLEKPR